MVLYLFRVELTVISGKLKLVPQKSDTSLCWCVHRKYCNNLCTLAEARASLVQEIETMACLSHPNCMSALLCSRSLHTSILSPFEIHVNQRNHASYQIEGIVTITTNVREAFLSLTCRRPGYLLERLHNPKLRTGK